MKKSNRELIDRAINGLDEFDLNAIADQIRDSYEFDEENAKNKQLLMDIQQRVDSIKDSDNIREVFHFNGDPVRKHRRASSVKSPNALRLTSRLYLLKAQGLQKSAAKLNGLAFMRENQYKLMGTAEKPTIGLEEAE